MTDPLLPIRLMLEKVALEPREEGHTGEVGAAGWVEKAMEGPPSAGTVGRMELLRHWNALPRDKRLELIRLVREMVKGERGR